MDRQRVIHPRRCGGNLLTSETRRLASGVLAISSRHRHTHLPACVTSRVWAFGWWRSFRGSWGHPGRKRVHVFVPFAEQLCLRRMKPLWINHRARSWGLFSLSCGSKFILDVPNTRGLRPSFCKTIQPYKQSWEGLCSSSAFWSFPVNVCPAKLV